MARLRSDTATGDGAAPGALCRRGRPGRCGLRSGPGPPRRGHRVCASRRCSCAPPITAICSSSSCRAERIPYVKYGGLRFLEAAHVKDLMCLFRLADNHRDELAWFRLLQLLDGVGPVRRPSGHRRRSVSTSPAATPRCRLRWPLAAEELPAAARPAADALVVALARGDRRIGRRPRASACATRSPRSIASAYDNADARLADLDALVARQPRRRAIVRRGRRPHPRTAATRPATSPVRRRSTRTGS